MVGILVFVDDVMSAGTAEEIRKAIKFCRNGEAEESYIWSEENQIYDHKYRERNG